MRKDCIRLLVRTVPVLLVAMLAGCGFPKSDVFKAFEAKAAFNRAKAAKAEEQRFRWLPESGGGSQDNNQLELDRIGIINVPLNEQAAFISNAVVECTNLIISSGGTIVGNSSGGISGYDSSRNAEDRTFTYETRKTVGTVMILTTSIGSSNLNVRFFLIEGRRAW
jgi:hypothetical protein